jgi:hypothetical protein
MPSRAGFRLRPLGSSQESIRADNHRSATEADTTHPLLRFLLWLMRSESGNWAALPVRVFYKFESGGWRCRSTRQLHKVYRCR